MIKSTVDRINPLHSKSFRQSDKTKNGMHKHRTVVRNKQLREELYSIQGKTNPKTGLSTSIRHRKQSDLTAASSSKNTASGDQCNTGRQSLSNAHNSTPVATATPMQCTNKSNQEGTTADNQPIEPHTNRAQSNNPTPASSSKSTDSRDQDITKDNKLNKQTLSSAFRDSFRQGKDKVVHLIRPDNKDDVYFKALEKIPSTQQTPDISDYYTQNIRDFGDNYRKALNAYIENTSSNGFSYLKGYKQDESTTYSFECIETPEKSCTVNVPTMPVAFSKFSTELSSLLKGHASNGTLSKQLKEYLEPLGVNFHQLPKKLWSITLTIPEVPKDNSAEKSGKSCIDAEIKNNPDKQVTPEQQENMKKNLIEEITKRHNANSEYYNLCNFIEEIIKLQKLYDNEWKSAPEINLDSYKFHMSIPTDNEILANFSPEALISHKKGIEQKNKTLLEYVSLFMNSLPSEHDDRTLIKFKGYTTTEVFEDAKKTAEKQPNERRFESIKSRLFPEQYQQESEFRDDIQKKLLELELLTVNAQAYEGFNDIKNAAWYMNLIGECLRQSMPDCLFKMRKIKISSGFRKDWKEKLIEWGIERTDKPSLESLTRKPKKQKGYGQLS